MVCGLNFRPASFITILIALFVWRIVVDRKLQLSLSGNLIKQSEGENVKNSEVESSENKMEETVIEEMKKIKISWG